MKLVIFLLCAVQAFSLPVVLRTDDLIYEIGTDGLNRSFRDARTGKEYLAAQGPFMSIEKDGRRIGSTSVALDHGFLRVRFGDSGVIAKIHVMALPHYLTFELAAINDNLVSTIQLPELSLNPTKYVTSAFASCRNEQYAAAVIPLNLETNATSRQTNGVARLTGEADRRVRLEGTKVAVLGCPTTNLLDRIEQIEIENGLPHPTLEGVWARKSPRQRKSYLFVDLSEATADAVIDYAKAGGFSCIVVYDGVWQASHGTYSVNRKNFPHGDAGLKAVSDKIHDAGLQFGMHNLDMVVDKTDPLVHPVPARGFMMYPDRRRILAADVGPNDTFIPTTTSPFGLLAKGDKSRFHGRDLRIGDEIITYDDLKTTKPFGFTGCKRGAHETVAAAHTAGAPVDNFSEFIGYYRPDVKSDLYDRVARAEAGALNKFKFDYIYPDGTGENLGYWPEGPLWYMMNLLTSKLYDHTRREVLFSHVPISAYSWHVFTRGNTTDYVNTGIMRHFDKVSLAGAVDSMRELQPFEFGWFGYLIHAPDAQATRPREMEYAWSKALAYGAAMSLETNKAALDRNGRTHEIFSIIRNWEELKLSDYFPERIRKQLKVPGREFSLGRDADGKWQILPVTYTPERYVSGPSKWKFRNPYREQSLRVTIEAKPTLAPYGDKHNIVLLKPGPVKLNTSGAGPLGSPSRQTEGLEFKFRPGPDDFAVRAINRGFTPAGWGCAEVILDSPKDLREHRALGTWVEGDGSGAYLHFVIEDSGRWSVRDYYVHLDFTGRRYVQIPGSAQGEVYDFAFPYSSYWSIRNLNFKAISRVYVFLSGVPPGTAVKARFGRLEALQEIPLAVQTPRLKINGQTVMFPVQLETDWYLEYSGNGKARIFDANGFTKAEVSPAGRVPSVRVGMNAVEFFCDRAKGQTAKITFLNLGEPLR